MTTEEIIEKGNVLREIPHFIPWKDVKVHSLYHIPPLLTEDRMDVLITDKNDKEATFIIVGSNNLEERKMPHDCVFARFLTERRKF